MLEHTDTLHRDGLDVHLFRSKLLLMAGLVVLHEWEGEDFPDTTAKISSVHRLVTFPQACLPIVVRQEHHKTINAHTLRHC